MRRLFFLVLVAFLFGGQARAEPDASGYQARYHAMNPGGGCCWTSSCCFAISAADVEQVQGPTYRVRASGETITAGRSTDGAYHLCACTQMPSLGYRIGLGEKARCLFVPPHGS